MLLMTKELEQTFEKYPLYSQEEKGLYSEVVVKYFNPCGAGTWLITEGEKQEDGDRLFYGYCHLFELESIDLSFGLKIERELYATGGKVRDYI